MVIMWVNQSKLLLNKILTNNITGTIKIGEVMIFNLIFGSQKSVRTYYN